MPRATDRMLTAAAPVICGSTYVVMTELLLGQELGARQWLGMAIVIGSVAVSQGLEAARAQTA